MDSRSPGIMAPTAKKLSSLWYSCGGALSYDQKRCIERAYLVHVVGAKRSAAKAFARGDSNAWDEIKNRQANKRRMKYDNDRFWRMVTKVIPELCPLSDLEWLIQFSQRTGVQYLLKQLSPLDPNAQDLTRDPLRRLRENMKTYE